MHGVVGHSSAWMWAAVVRIWVVAAREATVATSVRCSGWHSTGSSLTVSLAMKAYGCGGSRAAAVRIDLEVGGRLLQPELVARERDDGEAIARELINQRRQLLVVDRRDASVGRHVNCKDHVPPVPVPRNINLDQHSQNSTELQQTPPSRVARILRSRYCSNRCGWPLMPMPARKRERTPMPCEAVPSNMSPINRHQTHASLCQCRVEQSTSSQRAQARASERT